MIKKSLYVVGLIVWLGSGYCIYKKNTQSPDIVLDAVLSGNKEATKFLLERNYNVNRQYKYGHTLLHNAALNGDLKMVKLLVKRHALLLKNDFGLTAIDSAKDMKNHEIVTYLKEYFK